MSEPIIKATVRYGVLKFEPPTYTIERRSVRQGWLRGERSEYWLACSVGTKVGPFQSYQDAAEARLAAESVCR
jgi:hypothetical protein